MGQKYAPMWTIFLLSEFLLGVREHMFSFLLERCMDAPARKKYIMKHEMFLDSESSREMNIISKLLQILASIVKGHTEKIKFNKTEMKFESTGKI